MGDKITKFHKASPLTQRERPFKNKHQYILAIDTSCDETSAAVTDGLNILSNVVWSQASLHAKFGGVMPSLAKRIHEDKIDWVIDKALKQAFSKHLSSKLSKHLDGIAVTAGPGLAIALEVGITKAKQLANKYQLPIMPINHIEAHALSALAERQDKITFPAIALVASGGNTQCILINKIGEYEILAQTRDDALGEALDKAARMLGLGYPGAALLEKMARLGNSQAFPLPIPIIGQKVNYYSYSGVKTALYRLVQKLEAESKLDRQAVYDLAATFQHVAFKHFTNISFDQIQKYKVKYLLCGGGVMANNELRKRIRTLSRIYGIIPLFPYTKKLCGDNAAMIGVTAFLRGVSNHLKDIQRIPKWAICGEPARTRPQS